MTLGPRWPCWVLVLLGCAPPEPGEDESPKREEQALGFSRLPSHVLLGEAALARADIRVEPAQQRPLGAQVRLPAVIEIEPSRLARVTTHVDGHLDVVRVHVGEEVESDQVLARLHSVQVADARADARRALAGLEAARAGAERKRVLEQEGIAPRRELEEAEARLAEARAAYEAARDRLRIYDAQNGTMGMADVLSPVTGEVIERRVSEGDVVRSHETLFLVANLDRVRVVGRAYERDLPHLVEGAPAELTLEAYPGRQWSGTVSYLGSRLDPSTRTAEVYVELENPEGILRPGTFGTLDVRGDVGGGPPPLQVVVPRNAIQSIDGVDYVFAATGDLGEFRPVVVTTGDTVERWTVIEDGLAAGTPIAVSGTFVLRSELLRHRIAGA